MATDFTLPELGENVAAGDVLRVLVKPGDTIAKDQPVLELETDKATIEVPSSVAGTVKDVKVKAGENVKVGQAILSVDDGNGAAAPKPQTAPPSAAPTQPAVPSPVTPKPVAAKSEPAKGESAEAIDRGTRDGGAGTGQGRRHQSWRTSGCRILGICRA